MLDLVADVIPRFGFRVQVGVACEQGTRRQILEDAFLAAPELGLFAIADGMGGHQAGEVASREALVEVRAAMQSPTTLKVAKAYFERPSLEARRKVLERLRRVIERAHAHVREVAKEQKLLRDIGTTLDVVWLLREEVFVAHVGDGRVHVVRPNTVLQLTEDHTVTQSRLAHGHSTRRTSTSLAHAVGVGESPRIDTVMLELRRGDRLLLVSDGVWSVFEDEAELGHCGVNLVAQDAAIQLAARAAQSGSLDDRTALVIEIQERFARQVNADTDAIARDIGPVAECDLFCGMTWPRILAALSVAVHVEFEAGAAIAPRAAGDQVGYVILDGEVQLGERKILGKGATLFAESLVAAEPTGAAKCVDRVRALRIRRDDFHEICAADPLLAVELYRRLAVHLGKRLGR